MTWQQESLQYGDDFAYPAISSTTSKSKKESQPADYQSGCVQIKTIMNADPEIKKCPCCDKNPATEPHTCPFAEEIHGDNDTCICCDDCTRNCADDI